MTNTFNLEIKMKEFILALDEVLINYPKKEYNLKDKIQSTSYEILELIFKANNISSSKEETLNTILVKISMLDFYFEVSYKHKCINKKQLDKYIYKLTFITKLTYGWKNYDSNK